MVKKLCFFCSLFLFLPLVMKGQQMSDSLATDSIVLRKVQVKNDTLTTPLSLPLTTPWIGMPAPGFDGCSPWFMGSYGSMWNLHEGFNAQLGMSISAAFGKHAPSGVGFGQSANLAYAIPFTQRLSVAAGLYVQNMDWGTFHQTDFGFSAMLGYKVNDIVSLYAYGTKSLMPKENFRPMIVGPLYMDNYRDRIGAMAEFKIGENAKISVSIERSSSRASSFPIYDIHSGAMPGQRDFNSNVDR